MATTLRDLDGKHLVLGLTGGIAAYKAAELTRRLQDHGATVQIVMTEAATHFITPVTMQALSGRPVFTSQWDDRSAGGISNNMAHINLSREADAIVVAPASADFMAKLVHGRCDDLLSTLCIARACPLLLAPAMNREMWANPATQRNVVQLRADGITLLGPASGDQACGEIGDGRMLEAHEILSELITFFQPKLLQGKQVLVTAGPTFEPIDPVRGITNLSSGKMGYAIAQAAHEAGARVTLVSGPTALAPPRGVSLIKVQTAQQMLAAVMAEVGQTDVFVSVAAVADWAVRNPLTQKIKKDDGAPPRLDFLANPDILASVANLASPPYCVGFAAETNDLDQNAETKRQKKNVPLLIGNLAQNALGADENELMLYSDAGITRLARADKLVLARQLVAVIAQALSKH